MQAAGVQACAKHFSKSPFLPFNKVMPRLTNVVGNEQELNRGTISSNIDDRTNHEVRPERSVPHSNINPNSYTYGHLQTR
jgi:hypothetical protein